MEKVVNFIRTHKEWFTIFGLGILFYFIFFHNIGNYALMDVDETRYVAMARDMFNTKDFMTLYLNGEYFFEKPPLYFWGECLFFMLFGKVTEFTARFPVALYGTLTAYLVYFVGRKIVSRKFGVISSLILATSLEFVILAKFAILDIVVSFLVAFSVCFGLLTFFVQEQNKKYFWWLFYIFSALAVMAKGIPGFVIPFGTMFFAALATKKFKELFKPVFLIPGVILFLLIVLPWHILMFKIHDPLFYNEYIMKHHVDRFLGKGTINRTEPFYFYFLTVLWGFFPWICSFVSVLVTKIKSIKLYAYEKLTDEQRWLYLNSICALFIILFFSASSTKLVTYILPIYVPLAFIGGYIWLNYDKFKKQIDLSNYIMCGLLALASVVAIFTPLFLPEQLYSDILNAKWLSIILLGLTGILGIVFTLKNKVIATFSVLVGCMLVLSAFGTKEFYNVDYKFGQNDLMEFATYAKENNYELAAVNLGRKYSLLYYRGGHIDYIDEERIAETLENPNELVIIKTKNLDEFTKSLKYQTVLTGRRYTLIKGK